MSVLDVPGYSQPQSDARFRRTASIAERWGRRIQRPKLSPMASPPSVVVGTAGTGGGLATTTLAGSSLVAYTDTRLRYLGADLQPYSGNALYGRPKRLGTATDATGLSVQFGFNGQVFEFGVLYSANFMYRILVNGVPATALWQTFAGTSLNDYLIKVDLGVRDAYDITIQLHQSFFRGLRVLPTDLIYPAAVDNPLRLHILGDSFVYGQSYASGAQTNTPGFIYRVGELLGIEDTWGRGIGGTGYIASTQPFISRLAQDVIPYQPDILYIPASVNDTNTLPPAGALATAINAIAAAMKAGSPTTKIIASSVLFSGATNANITSVNTDVKNAWTALGVSYIDFTGINNGGGTIDVPTGTGSGDFNRSGDGTHPSWPNGYDYFASRIASALAPIIRDAN